MRLARSRFRPVPVVLAAIVATAALASAPTLEFENFTVEDGLSQSAVKCIAQDDEGFLWIGTEDGLNRFDGYEFRVFRRGDESGNGLAAGYVWALHVDGRGRLWIGTDDGLQFLDAEAEAFRTFPVSDDGAAIPVRTIIDDGEGGLWIGTEGRGVARLHEPRDPAAETAIDWHSAAPYTHVRTLLLDPEGRLWIGTFQSGLHVRDGASGEIRPFEWDDPPTGGHGVRSISLDADGRLLVGTDAGWVGEIARSGRRGLRGRRVDLPEEIGAEAHVESILTGDGETWLATDQGLLYQAGADAPFHVYRYSASDPASLTHSWVTSLFRDDGGVLWIGTKAGGINKWNGDVLAFEHVTQASPQPLALSSNVVTAFAPAPRNGLWVGTFGGGLNHVPATGEPAVDTRGLELGDDTVMSLLTDSQERLWVGTRRAGLIRFDPDGGRTHFPPAPGEAGGLGGSGIVSMYESTDGTVWVSVWDAGLHRFVSDERGFERIRVDPDDPRAMDSGRVTAIRQDAEGAIWLATDGGGLSRLGPDGEIRNYRASVNQAGGLPTDSLYSLYFDPDGSLWIGTQGEGLLRWVPDARRRDRLEFHRWTERDGLPNGHVYAILPDAHGHLWLSTNNGLSRFDPHQDAFSNFSTIHGLQSKEFNFGAALGTEDGRLHFGGVNGLNSFRPAEDADHNAHQPPVRLVQVLRGNEPIVGGLRAPRLEALRLGHADRIVQLEFAVLDFVAPQRNRYAYRLDGLHSDWIDLGESRRVTLTKLPAGHYRLKVRGANSHGEWSEAVLDLPLEVIAPPWFSKGAYAIYSALLLALGMSLVSVQSRRLRRQARYRQRLEREVAARTNELAQRNAELEDLNGKLQEATLTDPLTGVRNRRYLMTRLQEEIDAARSGRDEDRFVFMIVDMDGLKDINDTHGHLVGDRAIRRICQLLQKECRRDDSVIRWGGDEFIVVARGAGAEVAERLAERIRRTVGNQVFELPNGDAVQLSCSIGIACYPFTTCAPESVTWEQVIAVADRALYIAKQSGRNAWAGLYATKKAVSDRLPERALKETEGMLRQRELELRSSIRDSTRLQLGMG